MPQHPPPCQIKQARFKRACKRAYWCSIVAFPSAVTVMPRMVVPMMPAMRERDRLKLNAGDAGRDIQSGLALHADRLQRVGIGRTADQEIAATANTDRRI